MLVLALMLSSADDVSIEPITALSVAAGGGAGAIAGLIGGVVVATTYSPKTATVATTMTLLGGTALGAAVGAAGPALLLSPDHALLSAASAFAGAPVGMIGGAVVAIVQIGRAHV